MAIASLGSYDSSITVDLLEKIKTRKTEGGLKVRKRGDLG